MDGNSNDNMRRTRFFVMLVVVAVALIVVIVLCIRLVIVPATETGGPTGIGKSEYHAVDLSGYSLDDIQGNYVGYFTTNDASGATVCTRCDIVLESDGGDTGSITIIPIETGLEGEELATSQSTYCRLNRGTLYFSYDMLGDGVPTSYSMDLYGFERNAGSGNVSAANDGGSSLQIYARDINTSGLTFAAYAEMLRV